MTSQVDKDTRKPVKVTASTWEAIAHERVDRRSSFSNLIAIAWGLFSALPEAKRERLVREFEERQAPAA